MGNVCVSLPHGRCFYSPKSLSAHAKVPSCVIPWWGWVGGYCSPSSPQWFQILLALHIQGLGNLKLRIFELVLLARRGLGLDFTPISFIVESSCFLRFLACRLINQKLILLRSLIESRNYKLSDFLKSSYFISTDVRIITSPCLQSMGSLIFVSFLNLHSTLSNQLCMYWLIRILTHFQNRNHT